MFLQVDIHDKFILNCTNQIRQSADLFFNKSTENTPIEEKSAIPREELQQEAKKTVRCLTVLKEYVGECDDEHAEERAILPHGRYAVNSSNNPWAYICPKGFFGLYLKEILHLKHLMCIQEYCMVKLSKHNTSEQTVTTLHCKL